MTSSPSGARGPDGPAERGAPVSGRPPTPRTAGEMLEMAKAFLVRKGVEESRLEADLLVAFALGLDRLGLLMQLDAPVRGVEIDRARDLLVRRGRHEPVAYITGSREFYSRSFVVEPAVLIPRPETELVVDVVRDHLREHGLSTPRVLDVGTGSGCIAITLALEVEGADVTAVDNSREALGVAERNAEALGATVRFVAADGFACGNEGAPWDVVVSNPPYVDRDEASALAPEVRDYEPEEALFAPPGDPDRWVRELVGRVETWLVPGGLLAVELGADQQPRVLELVRASGFEPRVHADLARLPRVLEIVRPPA